MTSLAQGLSADRSITVELTRRLLQSNVFQSLYLMLSNDSEHHNYIVNFSKINDIDEAGVFWLNQFVERAKRCGMRVKLVNLNARIWLRCLEAAAETHYYRYS